MAQLRKGRLRWAIAGVLVVALAAAVIVAWPLVQRYTGAAPPAQSYERVQLDPALDYAKVLGVAHNAGNNPGTLATALRDGADVIEVDVLSAHGQLVGGRPQPWSWLAERLFRGPTLAEAWNQAAAADVLKLDLMQTDHKFLDELVAFLTARSSSRRVMISSRDMGALAYLHRRRTSAALMTQLHVRRDTAAVDLVDGAGDEGGLPGGEERDQAAEFGRVTEPAHRDPRGHRRELFLELGIGLRADPGAGDDPLGQE